MNQTPALAARSDGGCCHGDGFTLVSQQAGRRQPGTTGMHKLLCCRYASGQCGHCPQRPQHPGMQRLFQRGICRDIGFVSAAHPSSLPHTAIKTVNYQKKQAVVFTSGKRKIAMQAQLHTGIATLLCSAVTRHNEL